MLKRSVHLHGYPISCTDERCLIGCQAGVTLRLRQCDGWTSLFLSFLLCLPLSTPHFFLFFYLILAWTPLCNVLLISALLSSILGKTIGFMYDNESEIWCIVCLCYHYSTVCFTERTVDYIITRTQRKTVDKWGSFYNLRQHVLYIAFYMCGPIPLSAGHLEMFSYAFEL